jgi:uncharacterized protein involved in outer membrane biogenesis
MRKVLLGTFVVVLVAVAGLFLWARAALTGEGVRTALASQLSQALGQPVGIGDLGVDLFPGIGVQLEGVTIGAPPRIEVRDLSVTTGLWGLISRRIENATVSLNGARIDLPLPTFAFGAADPEATAAAAAAAPLEIASVDRIRLRDVEIVSGGRTVRGDVDASLRGQALTLDAVRLAADGTTVEATGEITDLSGPVGELQLQADMLRLDDLMAFGGDFSKGLGEDGPATAEGDESGMDLRVSLEAERASFGELALEDVSGSARLTEDGMSVDPVAFGVFGGRYEGTLALENGDVPTFGWKAVLTGVDVAEAMRLAADDDLVTGRLSGRIDLTGRGTEPEAAVESVEGTARVEIVDGVVRNLGLVRTIVVATSGRADAPPAEVPESRDEAFSRLAATLTIANGVARTSDLQFESDDLSLTAAGEVRLDGSAIALDGRVQLSDELSKQAGRDLVRYTQEEGRVTLPVKVRGTLEAPSVQIDVADLTRRAIQNRATDEVKELLKKRLGGLAPE